LKEPFAAAFGNKDPLQNFLPGIAIFGAIAPPRSERLGELPQRAHGPASPKVATLPGQTEARADYCRRLVTNG